MNMKEARKLAEVANQLRRGPGNGWQATLAQRDLGPWTDEEIARMRSLSLWLDTWILPALDKAVSRYITPRHKGKRS